MTENEKVIRHRLLLALVFVSCASRPDPHTTADEYLERYFATFPTRATIAGRHDHDGDLERLDSADRSAWLAFNEEARRKLVNDDVDAMLLQRHIDREIHGLKTLRTPERYPLYWTEIIGNSVVFLLMRDQRVDAANARVASIPRLVANAEAALSDAGQIAPKICAIAAAQARASATFFRSGFATVGDRASAERAAEAADQFASFLAELQKRATGTPRLGSAYAENLRLATGTTDVDATLAQAERDLATKKKEAADYARSVWPQVTDGLKPVPHDNGTLMRALFARIAIDHARTDEEWVAYGTRRRRTMS